MRNLLLFLLFALSTTLLGQALPQKYSRVKVFLHETHISELAELGLEYDHGIHAKGRYWINEISAREVTVLKENNLDFEILIDDLQAWYHHQNSLPAETIAAERDNGLCDQNDLSALYQTPENYTYGSMGGYHTYTELLAVLADMKAKFPNLISEIQPIGDHLTQEGRPIHWLKIGINPNEDEDKPEILYNALHHAREPNSLAQLLFYMWYLLENYETDAEIKYLLENVELYFIPCVNPDGYIYNETTNPEGGGFWRKNRWVNEEGNKVGVDLNRNYGFHWGIDDQGSSKDQLSEVYRGPSAFSEPETQALRDFCTAHEFKIALNYHAFSNLLIIPWGFDNTLTPDDDSYRALGKKMTEQNNYVIGTGLETVGYLVNGDSDDWMYGEQTTKKKILSMTPEVGPGTFGFWPPQSAIDGLNKDNLWQNISAAGLLKSYGEIIDTSENTLKNPTGILHLSLQNIGLETGEFTVSIQSISENLSVENNTQSFQLAHLEKGDFAINYSILESDLTSQDLEFEVIINNGSIERRSVFSKKYYALDFASIFLDNAEAGLENWTNTGNWGRTTAAFFSPNTSYTDSPNGDYQDNSVTSLTLKNPIDLRDAQTAILSFRGKWAVEKGFDFVQLKLSSDQENFTSLCGNYTSLNGNNEFIYDGIQEDWVLEEIDISQFAGEQVYLQFDLVTDQFVTDDGFYFDDLMVSTIQAGGTTSTTELTSFDQETVTIQPNPFDKNFHLSFVLKEKTSDLTIRLLNALGQEMEIRTMADLSVGAHSLQWENNRLENGLYFLQLQTADNQIITKKVLKLE